MADRPLRICAVISGLGSGGSERVMTTLAAEWIGDRHEVALVTLADTGTDFYPIADSVTRVGLDSLADSSTAAVGAVRNLRRTSKLRSAILDCRPDAVLSFGDQTNVLVLLATRGTALPVVVSERASPKARPLNRAWATLRRLTYPFAARIVVQTEGAARWATGFAPRDRVAILHNPISRRFLRETVPVGPRPRRMLAMGRFSHEKGMDVLLKAFRHLAPDFPDWTLSLVGAGADAERLHDIASGFPRSNQIDFREPVSDPETEFDRSSVFVLPSRFEGFPNALVEAMVRGCAVVASDCDWGPGEIITHGTDGLLVPPENPEALAAALATLLHSEAKRAELGRAATVVRSRFEPTAIASRWIALLREVTGRGAER